MYRGRYIFATRNTHACQAVGICQLHVVRASDGGLRVVARVKELLPLAYHTKIAIVHDGNLDGDALLAQSRQLLNVHLDATITSYCPDRHIWHTHFDAHGGRKGKAHGAKAA